MKYFYLFLFSFLPFFLHAQIINFPDATFKNKLLSASSTTYVAQNASGNFVAIDTNGDNEIDVAEALMIYELDVKSSNISNVSGIENFINLTSLEINLNNITDFDGSALVNLEYLDFSNNDLITTNLTGLVNLVTFWAFGNPFTTIDVSTLAALDHFNISMCDNLTALDVSNLTNLVDLSCWSNDSMTTLLVGGCTSLEDLSCDYGGITALDLSGLANLNSVFAGNNNIATVDVTGCVSLGNLNIEFNQLTSLVVQDLPWLQSIQAQSNQISEFIFTNCPFFASLGIANNQLTTLDLSDIPNISNANASGNQLETLLMAEENELVQIDLSDNNLQEINLNESYNFNWGQFDNNPNLAAILLKNGSMESLFNINIDNLPNLTFVCGDFEQIVDIQNWLDNEGYTMVNVNDYCTFVPGGKVYEVQGQAYFDYDGNGCDENDPIVPFLHYTVDNGTYTGTGFANQTGFYYIPVQEGTHTITPISPNPDMFDVVPPSFTVTFPGMADPYVQDFCFVPNSVANDLQVILTPITPARPGFDADYELLVNNVGNQIMDGDVVLEFPSDLVTFVDSDVPFDTSDASSMTWNFSQLQPFQSMTVNLTFNVNPPTDPTNPVNIDDVLTYTATVNPIPGDANPADNIFVLNQTVVGSFDPNDIMCLEGEQILIEDVGEYVHYRIRFENTGTFPAENIVVKNIISTSDFDMSSFQVLSGSHEFVTRITDNQVEFIFEGVNLPFDDANNDGYIVYKIRTLPTLQQGDIFSNDAEIFFDYNFPIETNLYETEVVEALSIGEVVASDAFSIYPNPADSELMIRTALMIERVHIYNTLGELVKEYKDVGANPSIEVSDLRAGIYMVQIATETQSTTKKFIKK